MPICCPSQLLLWSAGNKRVCNLLADLSMPSLLVFCKTPETPYTSSHMPHSPHTSHPDTFHHGGCSQPMCDPKGCATILGAVAGGGGGGALGDPNLGGRRVRRSAAGLPEGGGGRVGGYPNIHTSK